MIYTKALKELNDLIARMEQEMEATARDADDQLRDWSRRDESDIEWGVLNAQRTVLVRARDELAALEAARV